MNDNKDNKKCNRCGETKSRVDFYVVKNGKSLHSKCKVCCSIINKEYHKTRNKDTKAKYNKMYYEQHKQMISSLNREDKNAYQRTYYSQNKSVIFAKEKERYHTDVQYRLAKIYRNRFNSYIKGESNVMSYLNCSIICFQDFVEKQFYNNMSWDNKGEQWEIDHVLPVSKFDLTNKEHVQVCFHWCNLRVIEKSVNKQKSNKFIESSILEHRHFCQTFSDENNIDFINIHKFYIDNFHHK